MLVLVGVLTITGSIIYTTTPSILPASTTDFIDAQITQITPVTLVRAFAGVLAIFALWLGRQSLRQTPPSMAPDTPPEHPRETTLTGADFDAELKDITESLKDRDHHNSDLHGVKSTLHETLIEILTTHAHHAQEHAEKQIADGEWTTNTTAQRFLSSDSDSTYPVRRRILWWLLPAREFNRRVTETITAIQERYRAETTSETVPVGEQHNSGVYQ